jgi:hypothetical protein
VKIGAGLVRGTGFFVTVIAVRFTMATGRSPKFTLLIRLQSGNDTRRFCEVRVDARDNVYVFQPREGYSSKVSYHESGQRHLKIGDGPKMFVMHLDRPGSIWSEEQVWEKSFENFDKLLAHTGQHADAIFNIDLPTQGGEITFAQVSIGGFFDPRPCWSTDAATLTTLAQEIFAVPGSPSDLLLCVRVLRLAR